jgi:hypothetical protein
MLCLIGMRLITDSDTSLHLPRWSRDHTRLTLISLDPASRPLAPTRIQREQRSTTPWYTRRSNQGSSSPFPLVHAPQTRHAVVPSPVYSRMKDHKIAASHQYQRPVSMNAGVRGIANIYKTKQRPTKEGGRFIDGTNDWCRALERL